MAYIDYKITGVRRLILKDGVDLEEVKRLLEQDAAKFINDTSWNGWAEDDKTLDECEHMVITPDESTIFLYDNEEDEACGFDWQNVNPSVQKHAVTFIGDWCDLDYPKEVTLNLDSKTDQRIRNAMSLCHENGYDGIKILVNLSDDEFWDEQWVMVYRNDWFWHAETNGVEFVTE